MKFGKKLNIENRNGLSIYLEEKIIQQSQLWKGSTRSNKEQTQTSKDLKKHCKGTCTLSALCMALHLLLNAKLNAKTFWHLCSNPAGHTVRASLCRPLGLKRSKVLDNAQCWLFAWRYIAGSSRNYYCCVSNWINDEPTTQ